MGIGSALSGLLLVLFLVVHLAGLLPALIAPVRFEHYATALHRQPWLTTLEVCLAATTAMHLSFTTAKTLRNRGAGNTAELRSHRGQMLEALDQLNEQLISSGERPGSFEHDCREGICGSCGFLVNGQAHGPRAATSVCQLYLREFTDGSELTLDPWRAKAFPPSKT